VLLICCSCVANVSRSFSLTGDNLGSCKPALQSPQVPAGVNKNSCTNTALVKDPLCSSPFQGVCVRERARARESARARERERTRSRARARERERARARERENARARAREREGARAREREKARARERARGGVCREPEQERDLTWLCWTY
jgi:hypothetical protein